MSLLLEAHYRFQRGLYQPFREDLGPLILHWSPDLRDPDWNHARLLGEEPDPRALERLLSALEARFANLGRPPVLALVRESDTPTPLENHLQQLGWHPCFEHRWQLWPEGHGGSGKAPPATGPDAAEIVPVAGTVDQAAFLDVFVEGFGIQDSEADLWRRVLRRSFNTRFADFRVQHYLARIAGEPAGVATLCLDCDPEPAFAGLYNLAVLPAFRRRGLGQALMARRLHEARAAGARRLFLQTESAEVERWDRRQGLMAGPVVVGRRPGGVGE